MRVYAAITAVLSAVIMVVSGGATVFADTTNNAGTVPAQNTITVQAGDYLAKIAAENNTTYIRIFDANSQIQNPNLIYPGEVLRIPTASEQLPNRLAQPTTSSDENVAPVAPPVQAVTPAVASDNSSPTPSSSAAVAPQVANGSIWDSLAQCESGGDWSINTGNGFYGGLQFTLSSWHMVGGVGYPNQASRAEQILRAQKLQSMQGWQAWPTCSMKLGL